MAAGGSTTSRSLEYTPTWALATVCFAFIAISIFLEHAIQLLGRYLKTRRKNALSEAVEKLKSELMIMGFISLLLAITQRPISKICIPNKLADTMLPCRKLYKKSSKLGELVHLKSEGSRKLFTVDDVYYGDNEWRSERRLAGADTVAIDHCTSKNMVSIISQEGLHQLHIFIFVMALMHVVYSVFTMALGRAKMKRWKAWEKETQTTDYQVANDPNRFRFMRQTTFGKRHMNSWTSSSTALWIKCFFRQFFHSVAKVDYLTLRHGFIATHNASQTFNFRKYIQRSLEDDFKVVVGISPPLWFVVVVFMLFDVHGWHVYLWVSFIPLILVLSLGTKLEIIVAKMALRLKDQNTVIKGAPLVQPNDELFWFGHPKFLLHFLHLTLFLNAFELAFFIWVTYEFGLKSCYHEQIEIIITRVVLAVTVQVICSYITLPLYALVTQMGSQYKSAALEEETAKVLKEWHAGVRNNRKKRLGKNHLQDKSISISTSHYTEDSVDKPSSHYVEDSIKSSSPSQASPSHHHSHSPSLIDMVNDPFGRETSNQQEIIEEEEIQEVKG